MGLEVRLEGKVALSARVVLVNLGHDEVVQRKHPRTLGRVVLRPSTVRAVALELGLRAIVRKTSCRYHEINAKGPLAPLAVLLAPPPVSSKHRNSMSEGAQESGRFALSVDHGFEPRLGVKRTFRLDWPDK